MLQENFPSGRRVMTPACMLLTFVTLTFVQTRMSAFFQHEHLPEKTLVSPDDDELNFGACAVPHRIDETIVGPGSCNKGICAA
ncbi:hypothetical protein B0H11DRAFT_2065261 [Mycena galericulata]|nr:hypothetical protein B0H11DRAFT_2065261 [Mycena galericulata]